MGDKFGVISPPYFQPHIEAGIQAQLPLGTHPLIVYIYLLGRYYLRQARNDKSSLQCCHSTHLS